MKIRLTNARLAFPVLFTARPGAEGADPTFSALLILDPTNPAIAQLNAAFTALARDKWADKADAILKQLRVQDRLALHDGATKSQYAGFADHMFVSARSRTRPTVFNRDKSPVTETDGKIYAGCYVNASIELYAQDNQYGKRINAQLRGVQFVQDGDAFAAGTSAAEDEFEDLSNQGDVDPTA